MATTPNQLTKKFIDKANAIISNGGAADYKALATAIGMPYNALHLAMKGSRNVPAKYYNNLQEVYNLDEAAEKEREEMFREKYIQQLEENKKLLEVQAQKNEAEISRLLEVINDKLSSFDQQIEQLTSNQKGLLSWNKAFSDMWINWAFANNPDKVAEVRGAFAKSIGEKQLTFEQQDISASSH